MIIDIAVMVMVAELNHSRLAAYHVQRSRPEYCTIDGCEVEIAKAYLMNCSVIMKLCVIVSYNVLTIVSIGVRII